MLVTVNGEPYEVDDGATVAATLRVAGVDPDQPGIAVAVGQDVVRRSDWVIRPLLEGESIEVVTATQGG